MVAIVLRVKRTAHVQRDFNWDRTGRHVMILTSVQWVLHVRGDVSTLQDHTSVSQLMWSVQRMKNGEMETVIRCVDMVRSGEMVTAIWTVHLVRRKENSGMSGIIGLYRIV